MRLNRFQIACAYTGVLIMLVALVGPILWLGSLSLQTRASVLANESLFSAHWTLAHYRAVLHSGQFLMSYKNSVIVSVSTIALSLAAGLPAAYVLSVGKFRGRNTLLGSLVVMRMFPGIALLIPLYVIFKTTGILNTRLAVVLAYTSFCLPLVIWVMKNFIDDLPRELNESAVIDGAGKFQIFWLIVVPLIKPGVVAVSILSLLVAWNDFILASVLTNATTMTLPTMMAAYATDTGVNWGELAASGILVIAPVIAFSMFVQRHLVAGLSAGAVKG